MCSGWTSDFFETNSFQDFYVQAIESDFKKVRQTHGWHCEIGHVSEEQIRFYLMIDPKARLNISDLVARSDCTLCFFLLNQPTNKQY